jgi:hypothetical protein
MCRVFAEITVYGPDNGPKTAGEPVVEPAACQGGRGSGHHIAMSTKNPISRTMKSNVSILK